MTFNFDNSYAKLDKKFFTTVAPQPVKKAEIVVLNHELAKSLDLNLENQNAEELATIFSGNKLAKNSEPIAQAYGGHQFGHFNILGDGRAHLLGEHVTKNGERFDIQLKGSGQTPYSRNGDGRAALKPMLREYIISEAMFTLGIPTTRSLAVVTTGEKIFRETTLPGAILTRVAASHIRVGTFQYALILQDQELLRQLADYTIKRHFPEIFDFENRYLALLNAVIKKQIELICNWLRVGFIHGVMNTDNMSICGETIDYGPCAFMNEYNPATVFSSIDRSGRYSFLNQPPIAKWNLTRFAECLLPLIDDNSEKALELATAAVESFNEQFSKSWMKMMRAKLGLISKEKTDENLIDSLLKIMEENRCDYTNIFADLTYEKTSKKLPQSWLNQWHKRLEKSGNEAESQQIMQKNNPVIIPKNHLVEKALEDAQNGDLKTMETLLVALAKPYENNEIYTEYKIPQKDENYQTFCGT